jgi:hypothetical protein
MSTDKTGVTRDGAEFQIFNSRKTIGVSAVAGGAVNGFYLDESVRKMTERDLVREILAVASVASMRGRLHIREQLDATGAVPPQTFEALVDIPTAHEYEQHRRAKLK